MAEMVVGTILFTNYQLEDSPPVSIFVASKTMKLVFTRGYIDLPWNEMRKEIVSKYFDGRFSPGIGTFSNDQFSFLHFMVEKTPFEVFVSGLTFQEDYRI